MFAKRISLAAAVMGTMFGVGGGCDMSTLNSLNQLSSMLDSMSDYSYYDSYDTGNNSSYNGNNLWGPGSNGYDLLDIKSG